MVASWSVREELPFTRTKSGRKADSDTNPRTLLVLYL